MRRGEPRIVAMLTFHNEMRYLEGWFANVTPHVDAIVALDDRSHDGSAEFVEAQPKVEALKRIPARSGATWNEPMNHAVLAEMAFAHGADWALGVDADERLERCFRKRAVTAIRRAERRFHYALGVKVRELWDAPDTYRVDGVWARKRKAVLFRSRRRARFDASDWHGSWAPQKVGRLHLPSVRARPLADAIIYHLRMIRPEDRIERVNRLRALDPTCRWQPGGYEYLLDTEGLELAKPEPGRDYVPLAR